MHRMEENMEISLFIAAVLFLGSFGFCIMGKWDQFLEENYLPYEEKEDTIEEENEKKQ